MSLFSCTPPLNGAKLVSSVVLPCGSRRDRWVHEEDGAKDVHIELYDPNGDLRMIKRPIDIFYNDRLDRTTSNFLYYDNGGCTIEFYGLAEHIGGYREFIVKKDAFEATIIIKPWRVSSNVSSAETYNAIFGKLPLTGLPVTIMWEVQASFDYDGELKRRFTAFAKALLSFAEKI